MDLRKIKHDLRAQMRQKRLEAKAACPDAPSQLRDLFLHTLELPTACTVAGYYPLPEEMDTLPLLQALADKGFPLCLPIVTAPKTKLIFRAFSPGDPLIAGSLHVQEPVAERVERTPNIILLPLLAFDRRCHRLGYGGGYYDRTLTALRRQKDILAFGLAYAAQEVEAVPTGHFDCPLDGIVTEKEFIFPRPIA